MTVPFIGSEALAARVLTPYALRSRFTALYPDVYLPADAELTATTRARAAWLWSRRRGVLAGRSAAVLHGSKWIDGRLPAQLLWANRHSPHGIETWSDAVAADEVTTVDGIRVTTPARTALDIARRYRLEPAVAAVDALARATRLDMADVERLAQKYYGRRGIRKARRVIDLADPGAESPKETWLRLLFIKAGFPRPTTQIPVHNEYGALVAVLDMGWENVKIAAEYEGEHHWMDRHRFNADIHRAENVNDRGWIHLRVTVQDSEGDILRRARAAFARRT